jgi:uncharacterized membrane protein
MKKYLLTGFILLLPLALTIGVVVFLFDFFTAPFLPLVSFFLPVYPGAPWIGIFVARLLALALLLLVTLLIGSIARRLFFDRLLDYLFERIPIIKSIYKVTRDLIGSLVNGGRAFQAPVMIPFPSKPSYSLGFRSGDVPRECSEKTGKNLVPVFAPTAPHPISGFLLLVPEDQVHCLSLTNEETLKLLVSCGVILPEEKR